MTDRFSQELNIRFESPIDPWPLASDALTMIEAAFGSLWREVDVDFNANTPSEIKFEAEDLGTLKAEALAHGGELRDVVIHAGYWDGTHWVSADAYVWPEMRGLNFTVSGPLRIEVEAFVLSLQRSVAAFAKRKRWQDTSIDVRTMRIISSAKTSQTQAREPLLRASGLKPQLWRWFVRNRDAIIIGLTASLLASIAIIVLQVVRVVPTP